MLKVIAFYLNYQILLNLATLSRNSIMLVFSLIFEEYFLYPSNTLMKKQGKKGNILFIILIISLNN